MCASQYLSYRSCDGGEIVDAGRSNRSGPHLRNQQSLVHCLPLFTAMIITISLRKAPAEAERRWGSAEAHPVAEAASCQGQPGRLSLGFTSKAKLTRASWRRPDTHIRLEA